MQEMGGFSSLPLQSLLSLYHAAKAPEQESSIWPMEGMLNLNTKYDRLPVHHSVPSHCM